MARKPAKTGKRTARRTGAALSRRLPEYEAKRDFAVTPEPAPGKAPEHGQPTFVVHKHDATRLHSVSGDGPIYAKAVSPILCCARLGLSS